MDGWMKQCFLNRIEETFIAPVQSESVVYHKIDGIDAVFYEYEERGSSEGRQERIAKLKMISFVFTNILGTVYYIHIALVE